MKNLNYLSCVGPQIIITKILKFYSHAQASEYYGCDARTAKQNFYPKFYVLDKSLVNPRTSFIACKHCKKQVAKSIARSGFCKDCSSKGIGLQYTGKKLSKLYKGKNNPNYKDGTSQSNFRSLRPYRNWRKQILNKFPVCIVCNSNKNRHTHHILPYALFPEYKYESGNGITLCGIHHRELHRLELDLVLLPILYESLPDVRGLAEVLVRQPQFQLLNQIPGGRCLQPEILQVVSKNYHKRILYLQPEFAQQVFGL